MLEEGFERLGEPRGELAPGVGGNVGLEVVHCGSEGEAGGRRRYWGRGMVKSQIQARCSVDNDVSEFHTFSDSVLAHRMMQQSGQQSVLDCLHI